MDSYYGNSYGESSQQLFTHTYSLWDSSQYYNTNELSPRNFFRTSQVEQNISQPPITPEVKPKREIVRDIFNRRIITKSSLYNEPDFFYEPENEPESPIYGPPKSDKAEPQLNQLSQGMPPRNEWTDRFWRRANHPETAHQGIGNVSAVKEKRYKKKSGKAKFMDALSQPIRSSKAENIMQKMGWQGGALGKSGTGIVEPIAPNVDYIQTNVGFGHTAEVPSPKKKFKYCRCQKQKTKKQLKEDFVTNALLYILEFVRNDWETEIIFDMNFSSRERRILHQCVNEIINECDDEMYAGEHNVVKITNAAQERALEDIRRYNNYVLYTESHGVMPHRQLCLYKDAPDHVYLVTPEDFKEDPEEETPRPAPKEDKCDDNPFLRSITRNLEPDEDEETDSNTSKLTKYFLEFVREDAYSEFRFLGPFNTEQSECLNAFLSAVAEGGGRSSRRLAAALGGGALEFTISENCNGSMVIHKRKKEEET